MRISRTLTAGVNIDIELTDEELINANKEYTHRCHMEDAGRQLLIFAGCDVEEDQESPDNIIAIAKFRDKFGMELLDVAYAGTSLREAIVKQLEHDFSSHIAADSAWDTAISTVLNSRVAGEQD